MWHFIRKATPTIAQILIICILLPFFAGILGLLAKNIDVAESIADFFINLASNVELLGGMEDAIAMLITNITNPESRLLFLSSMLNLPPLYMVAAVSAGMWAGICFKISKLLGARGLPLLQALIGMIVSNVIAWYASNIADELATLLLCVFSIVLNLVLSILLTNVRANILIITLTLGCENIVGIFSTAFAALLILLIQAPAGIAVWSWVLIFLCVLIPLIVFLAITHWLHKTKL